MDDPILSKLIRQMTVLTKRAKAGGVDITPADQEAWLRRESGGRFGLEEAEAHLAKIDSNIGARNLGRSAYQGAGMNLIDDAIGLLPESKGGAQEAVKGALRGNKFGLPGLLFGAAAGALGGGEEAKEDFRLRESLFRQEHPVADAAAGIGGAVASGVMLPGSAGVRGASTIGQAMVRGGVTGGVMGGVSGAGAGEGLKDRAVGGGVGLLAGGTVGAVLPGVLGGAKLLLSPTARATRRLEQAIGAAGGEPALRKATANAASAGRGEETMLADLSPHLRQAADFAANNSDDVFVRMGERTTGRQRGQSERLLNDVRDFVGDPHAPTRQAELEASRLGWAASDAGYDGLRKANPEVDPAQLTARLHTVLGHPTVSDAWATAQRMKLLPPKPKKTAGFAELQSLKIRLDNAVGALYKQGLVPDAQALGRARDEVVETARVLVPGYAAVDAEYAVRKGLEQALEAGADAWNQADSRGLAAQVAAMTPPQLAELRIGMASELVSKLRSAKTNSDQAKQLLDAGPAMQDKLRTIFGTKETFDEFMRRAAVETDMAKLRAATGGSATHRRGQAAEFDPLELAAGIQGGPAGIAAAASSGVIKGTKRAVARRTAGEMGPVLMTQGADNIDALLKSWHRRAPVYGPLVTLATPAGATRLLGGLLDSNY